MTSDIMSVLHGPITVSRLGKPLCAQMSRANSSIPSKESVTVTVLRSVRPHSAVLFAALFLSVGLVQAGSTLSAPEALEKAQQGEITLIDIRTPPEWRQTGVASGALTIDMTTKTFVQDVLKAVQGNPDAPIVLICRTGNRTGYTRDALEKMGFTNVSHVPEGMAGSTAGPGWVRRGLPVEPCKTC
jgi:rhodanese-related sulfurtransferase